MIEQSSDHSTAFQLPLHLHYLNQCCDVRILRVGPNRMQYSRASPFCQWSRCDPRNERRLRLRLERPLLLYSREMIRGMRCGVDRGRTGRMSEVDRGGKGVVVCSGCVEQECGTSPGFGPGDGNPSACGVGVGMDRGHYQPCSARNRARIWKARCRAAASSCVLGGGTAVDGAMGLDGLGT